MAQSPDEKSSQESMSLLGRAKELATILGTLGAAGGILFSSITYVTTQWAKNDEAKRAQLSTFSTYGQYLKRYQEYIQPALGKLMKDKTRMKLEVAMRKQNPSVCNAVVAGTTTKTGFEVFTSKELRDVRQVHNFYESIGYGLENRQLDFEVIFGLITVPAYWNIHDPLSRWYDKNMDLRNEMNAVSFLYPDFSVLLPWRSCLGSAFFGANRPLSDFSDSVDRLGYNYLFARMKSLYKRSCRNGKPLDSSGGGFISASNGKTWPTATLSNACSTLKNRINTMSSKSPMLKSWMKLYHGNENNIDPELDFFGKPMNFIR
jgi:hypothetical protein